MNVNQELINSYNTWIEYFNNLLKCLREQDYTTVIFTLMDAKTQFENELAKVQKSNINKDDEFQLDLLKLEINTALDLGNKDAFKRVSEEYKKLLNKENN